MIKNYISENISYLSSKEPHLTQDEFGEMFDLGKGLISNYIGKRAKPKIETIQRICLHYKITIDDFVNKELAVIANIKKQGFVNEPPEGYGIIDLKYVELLENNNNDNRKLISLLESKLKDAGIKI